MIIVIDGLNKEHYTGVLRDMYELRARVFKDRLGWEVEVTDSQEIDIFDGLDPAYIISLNDDGRVVGCMRLLQTTGPHMLSDVFADILDGEPTLRSPQVWEATRFCVDMHLLDRGRGTNSISYVTSEIMIAAFEYAMEAGVTDAVAVMDPVMNRVMIRSNNAPYDYLGKPTPMGKVTAMAGLLDCSEERINGIRSFAGIDHDVFASPEVADQLADEPPVEEQNAFASNVVPFVKTQMNASTDSPANVGAMDLLAYCHEQIAAARTDQERKAAYALMEALSDSLPLETAIPNCRA